MEIIRVSDSDFEKAVAVYRSSWQESHRDVCSPDFLENRDYAGYLAGKRIDLFLICDPKPAGVFCLSGDTLSDLYIHPEYQGRGYGTACIRFAMGQRDHLRLTVLSTNEAAISLYQKQGFQFTGKDIPLRNGLLEREMQYIRM